ncbi:MAG: phosphopyruvate hydratase, partial [Patescibacteria group bacterium]
FVLEPKKAIEKFEEIKSDILKKECRTQEDFDKFLIALDGTDNKENLGGNLILSLSLAWARLRAKENNQELFEYINKIFSEIFFGSAIIKAPKPIFNVINGGAHAKNKLDFQEFQVIPTTEDFNIAYSVGREYYRKLKKVLDDKFGEENITLGDEAGYSALFKTNEEALEIMADLIAKNKYPLRIGLDVAASQYYRAEEYVINKKSYSKEEIKEYYLKLIEAYDILSIEDPFYEEDFDSFASLTADLRGLKTRINADNISKNWENISSKPDVLVITDDLTTTNSKRLKMAVDKNAGNAILVKLNQIGSLTETLEVVKMAYDNNWQVVVSHRSGETMDDFIADLAVGVGAWGLKSGAPGKPERLVKYERVLKIFA